MVKVAIAGGSRGIGKAIATGIAERGIHSIIILTRNNNTTTNNSHNQSNNDLKTKTLAVDYSDLSSLQNQLEEEDIHTVISALSFRNEDSVKAQLNLIDVAEWASCTRRFMPSGFGAVHTDEHLKWLPFYTGKFTATWGRECILSPGLFGGGRIARGCGFEGCEGDGCCCGGWAGFGGGFGFTA